MENVFVEDQQDPHCVFPTGTDAVSFSCRQVRTSRDMVWFLFDEEPKAPVKHKALEDETEKTVEEALECDYDFNCTNLYKKISDAMEPYEWEAVIKFLDSGYWPGSFFADSISPTDQARTWVTRFDGDDKSKIKWSQLPLHLAIVVDAPFAVIGRLCELYPSGVRCTDDQHMLPLHLAMRHGAPDEVVAYLLLQFPEAVNAKGKNNRTPIECGMRSKKKFRAKIISTFVDRTRNKSFAAMKEEAGLKTALDDKDAALAGKDTALKAKECEVEEKIAEIEKLKVQLADLEEAKEQSIQALKEQVEEIKNAKTEMETDLKDAIEKVQNERLLEQVEYQKKIDSLEAAKKELEEARAASKLEEEILRKELETFAIKVTKSSSPEDLVSLKQEVDSRKAYRLETSRTLTKNKISMLREDVNRNIQASEGKEKDELRALERTVQKLIRAQSTAQTNEEIYELREEVESLRMDLKNREEASQTKAELAAMKKAFETELKSTDGKTKGELAAMRKAVTALNVTELESKTNEELTSLKGEIDKLKKALQEKELATKTKRDLEELKQNIEKDLKESEGKTKEELAQMKQAVEAMGQRQLELKNQDELVALKRELDEMKEQLKKQEATSKLKLEMVILKKALEAELKNAKFASKREQKQIIKAVSSIDERELENKDIDELAVMKKELETLKNELKKKEEASTTKQELEQIKAALETQMKEWEGKTREEIISMKQSVDAINSEKLEKKSLEELTSIKSDLESLKKEIKHAEEASKTKQELEELKRALAEGLRTADSKTEGDLLEMKRIVDGIKLDDMQIKNKDEWNALRAEINGLKKDLKEKEISALTLQRELENLKSKVPDKKKKKSGIKKFFKRLSFRKKEEEVDENVEMSASGVKSFDTGVTSDGKSKASEGTPKSGKIILPPRVTQSVSRADDSSAEDSEAYSEEESMDEKAKKMAQKKKADEAYKLDTKSSITSYSSHQSRPKRPATPKIEEEKKDDLAEPYEVVRTLSKPVVNENGDVELEPVLG